MPLAGAIPQSCAIFKWRHRPHKLLLSLHPRCPPATVLSQRGRSAASAQSGGDAVNTQQWLPWDSVREEIEPFVAAARPSEKLAASVLEQRTRAFPLGPDNSEPFLGEAYREVLAAVVQDLKEGRRLLCLSGPPGVGKSLLLRQLRRQFSSAFIGEISQPALGSLPPRLADGLGLSMTGEDEAAVQKCFQQFFDGARTRDQPEIQIIDDAETMKPSDLAQLRRLIDPIHGQLLMVGQPDMLALFSDEEAIPDRIYHLAPLSYRETGEYLRHRLREGGFDAQVIDDEAIQAIYDYCGGIPRLINLLCFSVLADADFAGSRSIDVEHIHEAAHRRMQSGSYPFLRPQLVTPLLQEDSTSAPAAATPCPDDSPAPRASVDFDGLPSFTAAGPNGLLWTDVASRDTPAQRRAEAVSLHVPPVPEPAAGRPLVADHATALPRVPAQETRPSRRWPRYGLAATLVLGGIAAGYMLDRSPLIKSALPTGGEPRDVSPAATALPADPPAPIVRTPPREETVAAHAPAVPVPTPTPDTAASPAPSDADRASPVVAAGEPAAGPAPGDEPPAGAPSSVHEAAVTPIQQATPPPLPATQRRYLARLYAERAQYESEAGRWGVAAISVRQGLEIAPDDARLRELKVLLRARETSHGARRPSPATQLRVAAERPASGGAARPELVRIYLERAKYEWHNRRLRDALVSIGYGLEGDPDNGALLDMRARVLSELDRKQSR